MPTPVDWTPIEIKDFSGGMRLDKSPVLLADNEVRQALNCFLDERGAVEARGGFEKDVASYISGATYVDNMIRFDYGGGSVTVISVFTTTYVKLFEFDGTTFTEITGGTALATGAHVEFAVYGDWLLICNGSQFQYWDGSGVKANCGYKVGSTSVVPRLMAVSDGALFAVSNTSSERFTVQFTAVGLYDTDPSDMNFVANYNFDVVNKPSDSTGITSLFQYGDEDNLLVATGNTMHRLLGEDNTDYTLQQISRVAGVTSPRGICETPYGVVCFVGNEQIYAYDGSRIFPIGDAVKTRLLKRDMSNMTAFYHAKRESVVFGYRTGSLVWHVRSGLKSAYTTKMSWDIGGWTELDISMAAAVRYEKASDYNKVVFCDYGTPYVYEFDTGLDDDGSDIEFVLDLKTYTFGEFMRSKECRQVWVLCDTVIEEPVTVTISRVSAFDGNDEKSASGRVKLYGARYGYARYGYNVYAGSGSVVAIADHGDNMIGHTFSVVVSKTDSKALKIYGVGLRMKPKERI
ncbi:MAG: hypothetical protein GY833_16645 [Aestuariibacter sp.]|nr:hypothetical protein [Aestuariibacter sp.]